MSRSEEELRQVKDYLDAFLVEEIATGRLSFLAEDDEDMGVLMVAMIHAAAHLGLQTGLSPEEFTTLSFSEFTEAIGCVEAAKALIRSQDRTNVN